MATNSIILRTPPYSDREYAIELLGDNTSKPYGVDMYSASMQDQDSFLSTLPGTVRRVKRHIASRITFPRVIVSATNLQAIQDLRESREHVCISPVWDSDCLTYLPLQPPSLSETELQDALHESVRSAVTFARYSQRFNSVNGRTTLWNKPHYIDAGIGKGLNVSNIANDPHFPSFQYKAYISTDATDSGATTLCYLESAYDADYFYAGQFVMVSTEYATTNTFEIARVNTVTSATNLLTLESTNTGSALTNTSSYTYAARTYVQGLNLVSDGEMDEDSMASWTDKGTVSLSEKSDTLNETGTRCMHLIGAAAADGVSQTIGDVPADTSLYVMARVKVLRGTAEVAIYNVDDTTYEDSRMAVPAGETTTSTSWTWVRFSVQIASGGAGQKTLRLDLMQSGATATEFLVDRVYIMVNLVPNGGLEGTYVDESGGGGGTVNIAPNWAQSNCDLAGADTLDESASEHGGDKAQSINVNATGKGIITDTAFTVAGGWYIIGGYVNVTTGQVNIRTSSAVTNAYTTTTGSYEFIVAAGQEADARKIQVRSNGAAANYLVDDVFCIRLMNGAPFDNAYFDLPEPLSTTGFQVSGTWVPALASTSVVSSAVLKIFEASQNTFTSATRAFIYWNESSDQLQFAITAGGTTKTASVTVTYSAGDIIDFCARCTSAGAMYLDVYKNGTAQTQGTQTGATVSSMTGVTRVWLRAGADFSQQMLGTISSLLIENVGSWTDAQVTALLALLSGGDDDRLALLQKTYGRYYRIADYSVDPLTQERDNQFTMSLTLEEVDRVGIIADQDA